MTPDLFFLPVNDLEQAQIMREIRNECKDFMTKSTDYITEEQQEKWFNNLDKENIKMFLLCRLNDENVDILGFGYAKHDGDESYLTGGIREKYRGNKYGEVLFSHLLESAKSFNTRITLEVLVTNTVAQNLYKKIGFTEFFQDDRIIKMEYKNDTSL